MQILNEKTVCFCKGCPVILQRIQDSTPPNYANFCVKFGGGGHYFRTEEEAYTYMKQRKFIRKRD